MFKLKGKNSLSELYLYLNYVKSIKNIDHSLTYDFINFTHNEGLIELINKLQKNKNEWISHMNNGEYFFDFMITEKGVTFKTNHWHKTVDFKD